MKMKTQLIRACLATLLVVGSVAKSNAATYTVDPGATWVGYMNVFGLGTPGYGAAGAGGYVFGSPWGPGDLKATFAGPVLSLSPNTIGDPDPFWYVGGGAPGNPGNKIMDASFYQQFDGSLAGTTVTFTGDVLSQTLALGPVNSLGYGWTSVAFIKDFAPDYSSFVSTTVALTPGVFSISLGTIADAARHVQFGFQTIGPDAWITDAGAFGSIAVTAVPEPASAALLIGGLACLVGYRRNKASHKN